MTDDLISRLLDDLRNEWSDEVQSAMHALASLGHPAVQHLLDAIESRDPILRRHAALVLEQLQPQEALPPLIELLTEEEVPFESKLILVGILVDLMDSSLSSPELFSLLVTLSHESEADIRLKSVTGLGKLSSTNGNAELCRLAQDDDERVRTEAQQQLAAHTRQKRANGIQPLEPAMLEAAARLRVRNGLSPSRQDAITELLTEGEEATRDLLPLLEDAGIKTLQEVTPLLKQLNDAKAHMPLADIVLDTSIPWQRRQMALRSLLKIGSDDEFLHHLFAKLLQDEIPALRIEALNAIALSEAEQQKEWLSGSLQDDAPEVRSQAALLLAERLTPSDKSRLRPILETLYKYPKDDGRIYLLQGLAEVLSGAPGDQLFVPEILDLLVPSDETSFKLVLDVLNNIVPIQPSAQVTRSLLTLLDGVSEPETAEQILAILVRVLPQNSDEASEPLSHLFQRFESTPIRAFTLRLLGRISDLLSIETLIYVATDTNEHPTPLQQLATQLLDNLEGTLYEVWKEGEEYRYRPGLFCDCGGTLAWHPTGDKEELHCLTCEKEFVVIDEKPVYISDVTTPICTCPNCTRKQALVVSETELPFCPHSQLKYVIRADKGEVQRIEQLAFGLCECCTPPQPLDLRGEDIVCIHTGRRPNATEEHAALSPIDTVETPIPTFSVSDTGGSIPRTQAPQTPPPHRTRNGRTTRPSIHSPSTLTRIRSFQLRQALLADADSMEEAKDES